ncbi:MAG: SDR family oxidoreductase [Chloroflexi bacterium]|nr:SDR family oxidoreductase [Chloroflexota bacterium]
MLFEKKVALITGAGQGIGRATAVRFAQEGAKLVIADVDETALAETKATCEGADVTVVVGSVASREDVQKMVDAAVDGYGRLDILINNAGITRDGITVRIKEDTPRLMSDEKWDAVLDVNLKGTWLCSQIAAIPMIKQGYGRIVNTASVSVLGHFGQANYSASKAGIVGMSKTMALELARYGINVNCVAPGATKTRMTAAIPEKIMPGLLKKIPMGRMAEPSEIAAVHAFLASDQASFITGQVIFADGGQTTGA